MPEAFVGGGTKSLSQLDDIAELAAPAAKQTIAKTVDLADRVYIDPTKTGAIAGSFSLRTPLETGNFKRARELFKNLMGLIQEILIVLTQKFLTKQVGILTLQTTNGVLK